MTRLQIGTIFAGVLGLALIASVPFVARSVRRHSASCWWDGRPIEECYLVRAVEEEAERDFCGIACAEQWLGAHGSLEGVLIADEESGRLIRARDAVFVSSSVVTNHVTGNRTHAFSDRHAAERHLQVFGGVILDTHVLQQKAN